MLEQFLHPQRDQTYHHGEKRYLVLGDAVGGNKNHQVLECTDMTIQKSVILKFTSRENCEREKEIYEKLNKDSPSAAPKLLDTFELAGDVKPPGDPNHSHVLVLRTWRSASALLLPNERGHVHGTKQRTVAVEILRCVHDLHEAHPEGPPRHQASQLSSCVRPVPFDRF